MHCPSCGEARLVYRGYRYNRLGRKRLRLCTACRRKITPDDGFLRMRFSPEDIRSAVLLRRKGLSLGEVQKRLAGQGITVSRWTILKWFRKYGKRL
ncbi:MAG: hypothetical protein HY520_04535 [Candidatus Aenigmarchaeota archaeon]|nr:hypothetical protein [Candidatus Aenigmarchaeota archaeon]